jgi:hypothetical protein
LYILIFVASVMGPKLRYPAVPIFKGKRWPAAGEWGFGGTAPKKKKSAPQASVREIKLVQDVKNMN